VLVDPVHGAEVLELVHLPTGRRLLGRRPPFSTELPVAGDLPEDVWTASDRGGWRLAAPNAGTACRVGEGRARLPRACLERSVGGARGGAVERDLRVAGHGLAFVCTFELTGSASWLAFAWRRSSRLHSSSSSMSRWGSSSSSRGSRSTFLPGWRTSSARRTGHRSRRPVRRPGPTCYFSTARTSTANRWPLDRPRSRLLAVAGLSEGRARVRNARTGPTVDLTWDASWLRHLWIWHETREYGGRWRGQTELLAIEPTSVPHPLGLAAAIEHGQALELGPGETAGYESGWPCP
jgi:hypothetical protein